MALISLHDIHLSFGGHPLFEGIGLQIEEGDRLCLVGRNGEGKSTLLKVIAGELEPDRGTIARTQGLRVAGLGQEVPRDRSGTAGDMVAEWLPGEGDDQTDSRVQARRIMEWLGVDPDMDMAAASGGMVRRALLARALAAGPDILFLDEPTNHLDIATIQWLEKYLLSRAMTVVFITHDRRFAKEVCNRVAEIEQGQLYALRATWDQFLERRDAMRAAVDRQREVFDKKLAQEEAWIRQGVQARRTRDEGRVKALLQMREESRQRRERQGTVKLEIQGAAASGDLVAETKGLTFAWPDKPVVSGLDLLVTRGDRIGIVGPNGAGKTTLIRLLLGELSPLAGTVRRGTRQEVIFFDQLRTGLDPEKSVAWNLARGDDALMVNGRLKHVNAYLKDFLFSPERAGSPVSTLSGGERNRLLLARLFTRPGNILVLDEPTNDLDAETMDLLEDLLAEFPGTILLVSHDRYFLDQVVTSLVVMDGKGGVEEISGNWTDLEARQERLARESRQAAAAGTGGTVTAGAGTGSGKVRQSPEGPGRLSWKENKEREELPDRIAGMEAELESLHRQMEDPEFWKKGGAEAAAVQEKARVLEETIQTAWARWEELEARA